MVRPAPQIFEPASNRAILTGRLADPDQVERLGALIGARLDAGEALCLSGPLGAGKSTLARGLIRALTGPDEDVPSPTFTLVQTYATRRGAIAHFDLYRLKTAEEAMEVGLDEALDTGAVIIEWPERLGALLPPDRLDIGLEFTIKGEGRTATLAGSGSWARRVQPLARETWG